MVKKFTAEELLPALLELRVLLQSSRTPWGKALQAGLLALLREHKAEVSLACDEVTKVTGWGSCCKADARPGKDCCRPACWPCCGSARLRWEQPLLRFQHY